MSWIVTNCIRVKALIGVTVRTLCSQGCRFSHPLERGTNHALGGWRNLSCLMRFKADRPKTNNIKYELDYYKKVGGFYLWTYTYQLVKTSSLRLKEFEESDEQLKLAVPNQASNGDLQTHLLNKQEQEQSLPISVPSTKILEEIESQEPVAMLEKRESASLWTKTLQFLHSIVEELMAPPSLGAIVGFIFGAVAWLKNLIVGNNAPLRVIIDSAQLLGNGTIPCTTLILGGNLIEGLKSSKVKASTIMGVIAVRYMALPLIGIWVVKAAKWLGFLAPDPLYHFLLMVQYSTPPAMAIGTMTQLFGVGQQECSVIMLWTYLAATLSLALWSATFMWILS